MPSAENQIVDERAPNGHLIARHFSPDTEGAHLMGGTHAMGTEGGGVMTMYNRAKNMTISSGLFVMGMSADELQPLHAQQLEKDIAFQKQQKAQFQQNMPPRTNEWSQGASSGAPQSGFQNAAQSHLRQTPNSYGAADQPGTSGQSWYGESAFAQAQARGPRFPVPEPAIPQCNHEPDLMCRVCVYSKMQPSHPLTSQSTGALPMASPNGQAPPLSHAQTDGQILNDAPGFVDPSARNPSRAEFVQQNVRPPTPPESDSGETRKRGYKRRI